MRKRFKLAPALGCLIVCSSCVPWSSGAGEIRHMSFADVVTPSRAGTLQGQRIQVTGTIFPAAPRSIYLAGPAFRPAEGVNRPMPDECVNVLADRDQFEALKSATGQRIVIRGELHFMPHDVNEIVVDLAIRGRHAHLYCQYYQENTPLIYLNEWHAPTR